MRTQKRLLVIPAALLLAGASSIGFVHASSTHAGTSPSLHSSQSVDAPGGADIQQGDQRTLDVAGAAEPTDTTESNTPEDASASDAPGGADVQSGPQN